MVSVANCGSDQVVTQTCPNHLHLFLYNYSNYSIIVLNSIFFLEPSDQVLSY